MSNEHNPIGVSNPPPNMAVPSEYARDIVDANGLAKILGLKRKAILAHAAAGNIPSIRLGKRVVRFHVPTVVAKFSTTV